VQDQLLSGNTISGSQGFPIIEFEMLRIWIAISSIGSTTQLNPDCA
jgi:hypothetical protein